MKGHNEEHFQELRCVDRREGIPKARTIGQMKLIFVYKKLFDTDAVFIQTMADNSMTLRDINGSHADMRLTNDHGFSVTISEMLPFSKDETPIDYDVEEDDFIGTRRSRVKVDSFAKFKILATLMKFFDFGRMREQESCAGSVVLEDYNGDTVEAVEAEAGDIVLWIRSKGRETEKFHIKNGELIPTDY